MRGLNTIFESLLIAPRELASTSNLNLSGIKMRTTLAVKTIDVKSWLNNIISKTEGRLLRKGVSIEYEVQRTIQGGPHEKGPKKKEERGGMCFESKRGTR